MFSRALTGFLLALGLFVNVQAAAPVVSAEEPIAGRYIVILKADAVPAPSDQAAVLEVAQSLAASYGGSIDQIYSSAITGFAGEFSAAEIEALAQDYRVEFIEQDGYIQSQGEQEAGSWGQDRVDQRDLPLDATYRFSTGAAGVHVYVIDSGIRGSHQEFTGRIGNGFSAVVDGIGTGDCNGHGTAVAGIIGGTRFGIAKQVTLHPVRIYGCALPVGINSQVIAGIDWVTQNHVKPAVANISYVSNASPSLDQAVRNSIAAGVFYALAAGNDSRDACFASPARVSEAMTVGGTTIFDDFWSQSNTGVCIDLLAPAQNVRSAGATSDTGTDIRTGTSFAAPHVAGAAALYLAAHPTARPAEVVAALVAQATPDRIMGVPGNTPNRLLYTGDAAPNGGGDDAAPVASFTAQCNGLSCSFDGTGSFDDQAVTAHQWDFGDSTGGAGAQVQHMYLAPGSYSVRLTVTDSAGQTASADRLVQVDAGGGTGPNPNPTPTPNPPPQQTPQRPASPAQVLGILELILNLLRSLLSIF